MAMIPVEPGCWDIHSDGQLNIRGWTGQIRDRSQGYGLRMKPDLRMCQEKFVTTILEGCVPVDGVLRTSSDREEQPALVPERANPA